MIPENILKLTLQGTPTSKARPRAYSLGGRCIRFFDPQKKQALKDKLQIAKQFESQGYKEFLTGALAVKIDFYFKGMKKNISLPKATKPDIDNLAKWYLDVLKDVVYKDDNIVADLTVRKVQAIQPRTEIFIKQIN